MVSLSRVLTGELTFVSSESPDLSNCDKKGIIKYFNNAYNVNESLFSCLTCEDSFYKCPDNLRLPLIFYYGHTSAVYVNKLVLADIISPYERVDFKLETIFETGVDEMSWDDVEHYRMGSKYSWPSVPEVTEFRRKVKKLMLEVIDKMTLELPINFDSPWWAVMMGIEHERIHIETSSVLLRQMPIGFTKCPVDWKYGPLGGEPIINELLKIDGSSVTLGKSKDCPQYGWDNEYGEINIRVADFETSKFLVTNGEFLEFVVAGGYKEQKFWSSEGWSWASFQQAKHPTFWVCDKNCKSRCGSDLRLYSHCSSDNKNNNDGNNCNHNDNDKSCSFRLRCIFDVIEMPMNWPVEVNYYEAKAFCTWKGKYFRLLSEAEHVLLKRQNFPDAISNTQFRYGSSTPVNFFPPNNLGIYDACGNVWTWLEDHFNGYPGFQTHYLYDDFTTPCFDGLHTMIAGGSWATNGVHVGQFSRFSFRRHFFQHMGFRVVRQRLENVEKLPIKLINTSDFSIQRVDLPFVDEELNELCIYEDTSNIQFILETRESLTRMSLDDRANGLTGLIIGRCLQIIRQHLVSLDTLLHIGCGAGGLVFEMKKYFKKVVGIDLFISNVDLCNKLLKKRNYEYINKSDIKFKQLTWIPNELAHQSVVIFSMADRIANLKAWSRRMSEVVAKGGILFSIDRKGSRHVFDQDEVTRNEFTLINESSFQSEDESICFTAWRK